MTPEWALVATEHVQQACELYDSAAVSPKRPAKTTFLTLNGKTYPAKFIRGLAYRLATGIDLDPSRDYSGGLETVRFFENLGLSTRHDATSEPATSTAVSIPAPLLTSRRLHRKNTENHRSGHWPNFCGGDSGPSKPRPSSRG